MVETSSTGPHGAPFKAEPIALAELHRFVSDFDPRLHSLPKRIDPALVERFLRDKLNKRGPRSDEASQLAALADFYETRGVVPSVLALLDRSERTDDAYVASLALTSVVGLLGDDAQWNAGRSYYHYLLSLPYAEARVAEVLSCYAAYAPKETIGVTLGRIDGMLASLAKRAQADADASVLLRAVETHRNVTVPRIEAAIAMEVEIMALAGAARLTRLVDIYLGFDERYNEIVGPWAVRMILREARTGGAEGPIAAFRAALPRIEGRAAADAWRARALHAIELLGGALTTEEAAAIRPANKRYDLLSNE